MREVVIVGAARTPVGSFGGIFKAIDAVHLGTVAAQAAIERAGIAPEIIEDVLVGNILSAGLGQNVARQIALGVKIPVTSNATTINMLCGSGLRAVSLAAQMIALGDADVILAGGTENMTRAPYLNASNRYGQRLGDASLEDSILKDALMDAFGHGHMGITAENIADQWQLTREAQDHFAYNSQQRAEFAQKNGHFEAEIAPVVITTKKGDQVYDQDEYPKHGTTLEGLSKLRPAFKKDGTVTAGNASGINDGAAMLVVMSLDKCLALGLKPLAKIVAYASSGVDPSIMGYGPVEATKKALHKAQWQVSDLDLIEANEAFAAQSLAVVQDLGLPLEKVNVNGGAIALGHPVGASGARVLVTLLYAMMARESRKGLATLCIGGGQGTALLVERMGEESGERA